MLDDLLSHPGATRRGVAALAAALEAGGTAALDAAPLPRLSWDEMQAVTRAREGVEALEGPGGGRALEGGGGGTVAALPAGDAAPPPGLPGPPADMDALDEWR